jgi:hypothetical protein
MPYLSGCCATETAPSTGVHNDSRPGTLPENRDKCLGDDDVGRDTAVEVEVGAVPQVHEILGFGQLKARSVIDEHYQ